MSTGRILATYRIAASESESRVRAEALAAEQSVEMPLAAIADKRILSDIVATVESIRPHAGEFEVVLGISEVTGHLDLLVAQGRAVQVNTHPVRFAAIARPLSASST